MHALRVELRRIERVAVVDDDSTLAHACTGLLARLGYHVTTVDDPQRALARFRENPTEFDLVLTDVAMSGVTGDRLALAILELRQDINADSGRPSHAPMVQPDIDNITGDAFEVVDTGAAVTSAPDCQL